MRTFWWSVQYVCEDEKMKLYNKNERIEEQEQQEKKKRGMEVAAYCLRE